MSHSLHNTVMDALGQANEVTRGNEDQDNESEEHEEDRPPDLLRASGSTNRGRRRRRSRNPGAKKFLAQIRKLLGHFNHSDRSVSMLRDLRVPGDENHREIVPDVATR